MLKAVEPLERVCLERCSKWLRSGIARGPGKHPRNAQDDIYSSVVQGDKIFSSQAFASQEGKKAGTRIWGLGLNSHC